MNKVEKEFADKAIIKQGVMLFNKDNSFAFIEYCKMNDIEILGIDGFYLNDDKIQPSIENSLDFSSPHYVKIFDNIYSHAINFIRKTEDKLLFEITCSK
jgi:hypothetical protein